MTTLHHDGVPPGGPASTVLWCVKPPQLRHPFVAPLRATTYFRGLIDTGARVVAATWSVKRRSHSMELEQTRLAHHLGIPVQRVKEIVKGKRGVTPETAWLLAAAFKTTPDFWMNLQTNYDLAKSKPVRVPSRIR